MNEQMKVAVINRDSGTVGYVIPDLNNLHRTFQTNETKYIPFEELRSLANVPGGIYLLENCLQIQDEEVIKDLLGSVEPEYYYSKEDVKSLLLNGSLEQLEDCLNFAPSGVIEILKDEAINCELNDVRKRDLIFKKTGLNISTAIKNNHLAEEENEEEEAPKRRKAAVPEKNNINTSSQRKAPTQYKVVSK